MSSQTDNTNDTQDAPKGWIAWMRQQPVPVRGMIFVGIMLLALFGICGGTGLLYYFNVRNFPRVEPFAVAETVTVTEFATFPVEDETVFPAAVAVASDGSAYTGSYTTGALWQIDSSGNLTPLIEADDAIGSVVGLDVAADGTLYVLDRMDPFLPRGAIIWQIQEGDLREFATLSEDVITQPNDIVVDADGRVYVADLGGTAILQVDASGSRVWWQAPEDDFAPAGLAIDSAEQRLLVTDARRHEVYALPLAGGLSNDERESARRTLYSSPNSASVPGFNGITITDTGVIYVAALVQNEIVRIDPDTASLTVIAGSFRGGSDVAFDAVNNRLLINNWDQSWLVPITLIVVSFDIPPRVPFSVDAITLDASAQ